METEGYHRSPDLHIKDVFLHWHLQKALGIGARGEKVKRMPPSSLAAQTLPRFTLETCSSCFPRIFYWPKAGVTFYRFRSNFWWPSDRGRGNGEKGKGNGKGCPPGIKGRGGGGQRGVAHGAQRGGAEADGTVVVRGRMDAAFQLVRGANGGFCENEEGDKYEIISSEKHCGPHWTVTALFYWLWGSGARDSDLSLGGLGDGGAHRVSEILILWPPQYYKCGRVEAVVSVQTQWSHAVLCLMMVIPQTLAPWITEM